MKNLIIKVRTLFGVLALLLILGSCEMVRFDQAPGERREEMPQQYLGTWILCLPNGMYGKIDTLKIGFDRHSILIFNKQEMKDLAYGRDYMLYEWNGKLVIALPDPQIKKLRNLFIVENYRKSLRLYAITENITGPIEGSYHSYFPKRTIDATYEPFELPNAGGQTFEMDVIGSENRIQTGFYSMNQENFERMFREHFENKNFFLLNPFHAHSVVAQPAPNAASPRAKKPIKPKRK